MAAEFDKIDRWQLRFGKRRPGCKWRSSFSRKTHCDLFPLWITIRGQSYHWDNFGRSLWPKHCFKDQLPSSAWAFKTFFFILKFCSLQQRWRSDSLLGVCWLGSGEKPRPGGRYWWRGGIGLTFIVFIVFDICINCIEKNSTRMAILMKNKIYKSTDNTFTPPPHRKEKS